MGKQWLSWYTLIAEIICGSSPAYKTGVGMRKDKLRAAVMK
jgi:hypothetical protein